MDQPTDYFSDRPFRREDENPDAQFYTRPRLVQHIDSTAIEVIRNIYGRHLRGGMRVLDLMSGWQSHIPERLNLESLTGLGMNKEEMRRNTRLDAVDVHDLNQNPELPYATASFDAVLCSVSVEYLTQPLKIFREVGRVLRPSGVFVVTFSNRWFPPKAVDIWKSLHDYERMGLVLEYFIGSQSFENLNTSSARGFPRPPNDKYYPQFRYADPVFAVWGTRI